MALREPGFVQSTAEFRIRVNGEQLPRSIDLISVHVSKMVNKIAWARIVIQDGTPAAGEFPFSNGNYFVPGNVLEISAGPVSEQQDIFHGIIVRHGIKITADAAPRLIIECRHKAVRLTTDRKSAALSLVTDQEALESRLGAAGFGTNDFEIEPGSLIHKEIIQYNSTDWDFLVSRADANGMVVLTNDEKIRVVKPDYNIPVSLSLRYGSEIIELEAEIDGRIQYRNVRAWSWDPSSQERTEEEGTEPGIQEQGDLASADIALAMGQDVFQMQHAGALPSGEIKAWADARLLKSRMAKIRGRVKIDGIAGLNPGDFIDLSRIGSRFSGKAFVSGVRQDFNSVTGWKTHAQFGLSHEWFASENDVTERKAGGLVPGAIGLHTAVVLDNEDPDREERIKVRIPIIDPEGEGIWARIAFPDAGNGRGLIFRPETGDEVVVGFMYDDPRQPLILGQLHSSSHRSPLEPSNQNHEKGYVSISGLKLIFNDDRKDVSIETPGGNKVSVSDADKKIELEDQNGNKISMGQQGITISSSQKIELEAGTELVLGGVSIKTTASGNLEIGGSGSVKLESSGMMTIRGSLVQIN
jgi:Rhs element Vgr protein